MTGAKGLNFGYLPTWPGLWETLQLATRFSLMVCADTPGVLLTVGSTRALLEQRWECANRYFFFF